VKIVIKTKNLKLTPSLRKYIEEKIGELDKFVQAIGKKGRSFKKGKPPYEAWVEVERTTYHHRKGKIFRAECQIRFPGRSIRAESTRTDVRLAVDEIKDELQREFKQYREKQISRYRKVARKIKRLARFSPLSMIRREKRRKK